MIQRLLLAMVAAALVWVFLSSADGTRVAAGVAVFLFGMRFLEDGFRAFSGGLLERLLASCAGSLGKAILFGLLTTALLQSSSLVSVLAITFLSAGMLSLRGGIGIILGSNMGTTLGAWLIAGLGFKVDLGAQALPMLALGAVLSFAKGKSMRGVGIALAGIGFLFLGIQEMKDGFDALKDGLDLAAFARPGILGVLIYAGLGAVATVIMQSSHATLILTLSALAAGQISYELALALAIGANVGTTVTAALAAVEADTAGRRLAVLHMLFNVVTGAVAIFALPAFAWLVKEAGDLIGLAEDAMTLRLALFHTLFNLVGVALFIPLVGGLERLLPRLLPDRKERESRPSYLDPAALAYPSTALEAVRRETEHLLKNTTAVIGEILAVDVKASDPLEDHVRRYKPDKDLDIQALYNRRIKGLHSALVDYIAQAADATSGPDTRALMPYYRAAGLMAQSVKAAKHLHRNSAAAARGTLPGAADQYAALRCRIGSSLRAIYEQRHLPREARNLDFLATGRADLEAGDPLTDGGLRRLVADRHLRGAASTSVSNDMGYARQLLLALTEAAQITLSTEAPEAYVMSGMTAPVVEGSAINPDPAPEKPAAGEPGPEGPASEYPPADPAGEAPART